MFGQQLAIRPLPNPNSTAGLRPSFVRAPSSEAEQPFHYHPLDRTDGDTIRLLTIVPNADHERIHCTITNVYFGDLPKYEALSYTWGVEAPNRKIRLNGKIVYVRENLYQALFHLRRRGSALLWVDAICINQVDLEERSYQVSLMPFVYIRSQVVIIFLNCEVNKQEAFRIRTPRHPVHDLQQKVLDFEPRDNYYDDVRLPAFQGSNAEGYWNRAWIIQEIGLGKRIRVHFRDVSLPWDAFLAEVNMHYAGKQSLCPKAWTRPLLERIRLFEKKRQNRFGFDTTLEQLLEDFFNTQCSDPYDHVFAFLGLASDVHSAHFKADYQWTPYHIFTKTIQLFNISDLENSKDAQNKFDRSMRLMRYATLVQRLLAKCCIAPPINGPRSSPTLTVRAVAVCTVMDIGLPYNEYMSAHGSCELFQRSMINSSLTSLDKKLLQELFILYQDKLKTSTAGHLDKVSGTDDLTRMSWAAETAEPWLQEESKWHHVWAKQESTNKYGNSSADKAKSIVQQDRSRRQESANVNLKAFEKNHQTSHRSQGVARLFVARKLIRRALHTEIEHFIGLVPSSALPGDILCRFWECGDLTVLLRPQKEGRYSIVGTAHLENKVSLSSSIAQRQACQSSSHYDGTTYRIQMDMETLQYLTRCNSHLKTHDRCRCR